ncbi:MAG: M67 family metallopeptidase [Chloroflexi bacterium]|nr:M67 family metallopeptidase [Chloroflexota bacterium]
MSHLTIPSRLRAQIHQHGDHSYPHEGAGLLLGNDDGRRREGVALLPLENRREGEARRTRYHLTARDLAAGEAEAEGRGPQVVGVFHLHPDPPAQLSETDRTLALPWFSYIITSVQGGRALESRLWRAEGRICASMTQERRTPRYRSRAARA